MEYFQVSSSPHLRNVKQSVSSIMLDVVIAMIPACLVGIYIFGMQTLLILVVSVLAAVCSEYIFQKIRKQETTIGDFSAVVTGMLLAMNLPPGVPIWIPIIGSAFSIIIVKQLFGGIGQNFMNPAMAGRVFLVVSYPKIMTTFLEPFTHAVSSATPLAVLQSGSTENLVSLKDTFLGTISGVIGETSAIALIIGGVYLILRKVITWHVPVVYLGSLFALTMVFNGFDTYYSVFALLSGGALLGGFFMLTDYSSSPVGTKAKVVYAFGAALITFLIRQFGAYTEGVMFSILLMNIATPIIERFFAPRIFGTVREGRKKK